MPGPLPPWNLFFEKICFLVLHFSGFFNPFCSFCHLPHKTCWRWIFFLNSVIDFFVWCASVIVSDQTAIMGGTLKRRRGESWFPLIWSQPPAACPRRLNPTNHNLVIPICNYHLRAPNNQVMCCNVTTIHRLLCPSIEADAAQQEREFLSSNSHYFRAGGAPPIQVVEHHLSRWVSTTYPGGGAPPVQVPPDFMLGITSEENFIQTSTPGLYSEEIVMKLGPCLASITVKNPFTTLSGKTCKSFKPRPCFAGEQIRLRETI